MMTPHDGREIEPDGKPLPLSRQLASRRLLLKALGVTAVGTVAATLLLPRLGTPALAAPAIPDTTVEEALNIASAAPMFQEAMQELQIRSFGIDASRYAVQQSSSNGVFVGLVLRHTRSASPRTGVDVLLTVDTSTKQLVVVQMIVGACLVDMFLITSTIFGARYAPYEELRSARVRYEEPPQMIRPRFEQQWSQPQPDVRPLRPDEFVESGWPEESPEDCYWHYEGCSKTEWIADNDTLMYRCAEVSEEKSCEPERRIAVALQYSSDMH